MGILLGIQNGRDVEICTSFEIAHKSVDGNVVLDVEYLQVKKQLYNTVFPKYDVLGWYSTGADVLPSDTAIHDKIAEYNESPLYLLLDTVVSATMKDLPMKVFESEVHMINDEPTKVFVKTPVKIETVEAERISVDHIAHITGTGQTTAASSLTVHLSSLHGAIKMLNQRVGIVHSLLDSIESGALPKDHELLRACASMCNRLPGSAQDMAHIDNIPSSETKKTTLEYNESLLIAYLASMTKGANAINELVEKFNVVSEKHSRRSRGIF